MMTGDVDAINERLSGLVQLLQVVGIDGVNPDALVAEQKRLNHNSKSGDSSGTNRMSSSGGRSGTSSSSDAQILEIIKKLQLAQADSPEILAALKSPELRALASLAAQKQVADVKPRAPPTLDDVMDDDDNYPKIGPGYSDDISVVSDLTTPTVMTKQQVADEEYYRDVNGGPGSLPPMQIGGGFGPAQPTRNHGNGLLNSSHQGGKTKNMVGQVRPSAARRAIAKTGGAAAQRRLNYQMAMTKLQSSGDASSSDNFISPRKHSKAPYESSSPTATQDPMEFPSMSAQDTGLSVSSSSKKKISSSKSKKSKKTALAAQEVSDLDFEGTEPIRTPETSSTSGRKKIRDKTNNNDVDWGITDVNGWPAFDAPSHSGTNRDIFVDRDGFFPKDSFTGNGDDFGTSTATPSRTASSISRKDAFTDRKSSHDDDLGMTKKSLKSSKKENEMSSEERRKKEKSGKKKTRRASLTM